MPAFLSEPQRWVIPAIMIVAFVGAPIALWWEKHRPTSYTRALAAWEALSTAEQRAADEAVLGGPGLLRQTPEEAQAEACEALDQVQRDAAEAAERAAARMAEAVQRNALFHP